MKQPVILQILPELSAAGGAEQGCIDVAKGIVASGGQALVVSKGGARLHDLARTGATHLQLPVHSKNPLVMMSNIRKLKAIIKRYNVDIVHARSRAPAWVAYHACKDTAAHFMTTAHAPYAFKNEPKRFYNSVMAKGERVIAISEMVSDYLQSHYRIHPGAIRLIHRGIAMDRFHPTAVTAERVIKLSQQWRVPDGANVIMLPGRLTRWKGYHILIDAIAKLGRKDVFCVLIGSDQGKSAYRQELEEQIERLGLQGQVRLVDHCDDMPAAYAQAGVVVSASTEPEGFGRVPVEAQAMGRPIIATDHGGARETIKRGETGWLVAPGDANLLARALAEALALSPEQRSMLATQAMNHVAQHFTRELMVYQTLCVYQELLPQGALLSGDQQGGGGAGAIDFSATPYHAAV